MKHVHFFQWNIPADNHLNGHTDGYIPVISEWNERYYDNGRPIVHVQPVNLSFAECIQVVNWLRALKDVEKIAENHFAELARQERINQARAVLQVEENPILSRLTTEY